MATHIDLKKEKALKWHQKSLYVNYSSFTCQIRTEILSQTQDDIHEDGTVICPDCETPVLVGTVGISNFTRRHRGSKKCKENRAKKNKKDELERNQARARQFFTRRSETAPTPGPSATHLLVKPPSIPLPTMTRACGSQVGLQQRPAFSPSNAGTQQPHKERNIACPEAAKLLNNLRNKIERLPEWIDVADNDCPLAQFSGSLEGSVGEGEDAWEVWNGPLDTELQKPHEELKKLVKRGEKGIEAVCNVLEYLATVHRIPGALLEGKIGRLNKAIDDV